MLIDDLKRSIAATETSNKYGVYRFHARIKENNLIGIIYTL